MDIIYMNASAHGSGYFLLSMEDTMNRRIAVLGAGGLGRAAIQILDKKSDMRIVVICDKQGLAVREEGITASDMASLPLKESVKLIPGIGRASDDALGEILRMRDMYDGIYIGLPNLPNEFIPSVVSRYLDAGYNGVIVDPLKRTRAMEILFELDEMVRANGVTYITGAGATPGLLSTAAVLGSVSFTEIESVDIHWGVGIANWADYKGTIREDIAHLPEYTVEAAQALTDDEVDKLLNERNGKLGFTDMEHADDLMLVRAGVVDDVSQVTVGGIMDTRSAKKPVSTTMTITGTTFEGKRSAHRFILGDETSMAANVVGTGIGYLKRAFWLHDRGIYGIFTSADFLPMVVR
jgi:hypothetical protein